MAAKIQYTLEINKPNEFIQLQHQRKADIFCILKYLLMDRHKEINIKIIEEDGAKF
jgi:hypothetical protein